MQEDTAAFLQLSVYRVRRKLLQLGLSKYRMLKTRVEKQHFAKIKWFLRTLTTWHYPLSPAALLCAVQQSIDISSLPGPQQLTCSSGFAAVCPCWDRQTDGQTDGRLTDAMA